MPSIWIFGYGSLVHRPGFEHARRVQGFIPEFRRVWWQGSTDHRGTPEKPGRVVTLEPCPGAMTWGVAYELTGDEQQQLETLRYLEWREKQYDVRHLVDVYGDPSQDFHTPPPPPVDISHLLTPPSGHTDPGTTPASSHPSITPSSSTPQLPTNHQPTAQPTPIVSSISTPTLETTNNPTTFESATITADKSEATNLIQPSANPSQTLDVTNPNQPACKTTIISSADPLMTSEEVLSFAPPEDWQRLRATEFLDQPTNQENGAAGQPGALGPQEGQAGEASVAGSVPGTRLLVRNVLCYIASSDIERNTNFLGPADLDAVAQQIVGAEGPSGPNWVYVVRLAAAMRQMGVEDPELFALESKVLALRGVTE